MKREKNTGKIHRVFIFYNVVTRVRKKNVQANNGKMSPIKAGYYHPNTVQQCSQMTFSKIRTNTARKIRTD